MISVYIHIPFCEKICSYCDFCKLFYNEELVNKYLCALEKEIQDVYMGEEVNTIYIGGGTPSSLSVKQLTKLFDIIKVFNRAEDFEFTIEGNFESTSFEKLDLYKKYGVNRLSFGIETTNLELLKFLNREIEMNQVIKTIDYCHNIGLDNINVDLMYALPGEDITMLEKDLEFICSLDIKHISTYSLIIENNTMLSIKGIRNISEDIDFEMYKFICEYLKKHGFVHYEISNFSKDGYFSKHNLVYWNNLEYYGFGLGAAGYIDDVRYNNTRSFTQYVLGKYRLESEKISFNSKRDYEVMLNLRLSGGINKNNFNKKFGKNVLECYNYRGLIKDGFLMEDKDNIYIPEDKFYVSNEIIVKFLEGEQYE